MSPTAAADLLYRPVTELADLVRTGEVTSRELVEASLDRIEALYRCSKDVRLVEWICQRAGGFFIRNPEATNAHSDYLIPATNEIVQEFADLLAVIATAASDNQINSAEAKNIRARWEELKSVTECFVACCEKGNFAPLKDKPLQTRKSP